MIYALLMTTLNPWINFNGNAEEAFNFYKSVFWGDFTKIIRLKDLAGPEFQVPQKDENKIMQIILPIENGHMLIGNDVPEFMGTVNENENRSKIHVGVKTQKETERIFNGLSVGGKVEVPLGKTAWGTCFGMFRDKYGIEWIIEFNPAN
jgi:PhnB protein